MGAPVTLKVTTIGNSVGVILPKEALARPRNLHAYADAPELPQLAAACGYGLARSHPFIDGNKRMAPVVAELFLALNGLRLDADDRGCVLMLLEVADGSRSEADFARWIRDHIQPMAS
jgi:death-on-curing protein